MSDLFDLSGRNAVVVGGAGGLGQAIAAGLAESGANVAIASRKMEALQRAAKEIEEQVKGKKIGVYTVDVCSEESVQNLVDAAVADMGKIDILVCSQGLNKKIPLSDMPSEVFAQIMQVNVTGVMICCKYFSEHMKQNNYGKIIILSSVRGKIASRNIGNVGYCTSKAAVDMLAKQVASELGQYNITVNAIGPTVTETPMMTENIREHGGDEYRKKLAANLLIKRMATPQDTVGPAIFLASAASDFVTGNVIYPDGGLTSVG